MADDDDNDLWGDIVEAAIAVAVTAAVNAGVQAITGANKPPRSEAGRIPLKQSRPPCIVPIGDYSRVSGAYMFHESKDSFLTRVLALADGRIDSTRERYLGDDEVTVSADSGYVNGVEAGSDDGRYGTRRVQWQLRMGLPTETHYSWVSSRYPSLWTSAHRGDGTASMMVEYDAPRAKFRSESFPFGAVTASIAIRGVCYDWRDGTQSRSNPATWKWSDNPVVWAVHLEWYKWGLDWDKRIAPVLSALTAEANYCDEPVPLKAGGTEKRYRLAGWYFDDLPRVEARKKIMAAMDGDHRFDIRGRLIIRSGRYVAPTVEITGTDIEAYTWSRGIEAQTAIDRLSISFTSAAHKYNEVECDPWIVSDGPLSEQLDVSWCPSHAQARRLAKRFVAKRMPIRRGQITTGVSGIKAWGERYILVKNPIESSMDNVPCEIISAEFVDGQFIFDVIQADPNIDNWNPATEEGEPVSIEPRAPSEPLSAPDIVAAYPFFQNTGETIGVRVEIEAMGPNREDLTWVSRWRVTGASSWTEVVHDDEGPDASFVTGFIPSYPSVDIQIAYRTGGNTLSPYSDTATVNTTTAGVPPAQVSEITKAGGVGQAVIGYRAPTSANFDHARIFRNTVNNFGTATQVGGDRSVALGGFDSYTDTPLAAGTYWYWVATVNASNVQGAPYEFGSVIVT